MSVNFNNPDLTNPINDPYGYVHEEEKKIREDEKVGKSLKIAIS